GERARRTGAKGIGKEKVVRREAKRAAGQKPKGREPQVPQTGPRAKDQINLTDEESRIMPSAQGFVQGYNAQAAVDVDTMLVLATTVSQEPNDKQPVEPILEELGALPEELGKPEVLLADNGYFSQSNVEACVDRNITPLIAAGRESHHVPLQERLAVDPAAPETDDPVTKMVHELKTSKGRKLYGRRKCTVEPVFGIIKQVIGFRQFLLRGLKSVAGEWKLVTMAFNLKRMHVLAAA
ncbi:MAG: transposase, partial [Methylococcales bacterium]